MRVPIKRSNAKSLDENRHDDTRRRLIRAGLLVFGQQGFEGASTREIAARAKTNVASIAYHFGGKKKLYLAVAEFIAVEMSAQVDKFETFLGEKRSLIQSGVLPSKDAAALLKNICRQWVNQLFTMRKHHLGWMSFIMREEAKPTEAFNILYTQGMGRFLAVLTALVGCVKQLPPSNFYVRFEAFGLIGLMLSLEHKREALRRLFEWQTVDEGSLEQICKAIDHMIEMSECWNVGMPARINAR